MPSRIDYAGDAQPGRDVVGPRRVELKLRICGPSRDRRAKAYKAAIDRDWPHQVALPAENCTGKNYTIHHAFCKGLGLSLCKRGHFFYRDGKGFNVFCFAKNEHAMTFLQHFGGEIVNPQDRPKWSRS